MYILYELYNVQYILQIVTTLLKVLQYIASRTVNRDRGLACPEHVLHQVNKSMNGKALEGHEPTHQKSSVRRQTVRAACVVLKVGELG